MNATHAIKATYTPQAQTRYDEFVDLDSVVEIAVKIFKFNNKIEFSRTPFGSKPNSLTLVESPETQFFIPNEKEFRWVFEDALSKNCLTWQLGYLTGEEAWNQDVRYTMIYFKQSKL